MVVQERFGAISTAPRISVCFPLKPQVPVVFKFSVSPERSVTSVVVVSAVIVCSCTSLDYVEGYAKSLLTLRHST